MRVVHILADASIRSGGATYAAYRIHELLLRQGIDSRIVVPYDAAYPGSVYAPRRGWWLTLHFLSKVISKILIGHWGGTGLVPSAFYKKVNDLRPDIVICHFLKYDVMSIVQLGKLSAPIFMFHHDLWPIRGITPYPLYHIKPSWRYPFIGFIDRFVKWNKYRVYRKLAGKIVPLAASNWVCEEIRRSGAYGKVAPRLAPLPLSAIYGEKVQAETRSVNRKFCLLNGANGGFCGGLKGGDRFLKAIRMIPRSERSEMRLMVFGEKCDLKSEDVGIEIEVLGLRKPDDMPEIYRQADLFAFPSRQETFGQTKIEALACGTPVVAFDETACAEGIRHKENGWIAAADDVAGFAEGIRYFYKAWKRGDPIRVVGDKTYSAEFVARKWMEAMKGSNDAITAV